MAGDITTSDLLQVQNTITSTVRYEIGAAREEFRTGLADLKASQQQQEARADTHAQQLAKLEERSRAAARGVFGALTARQKAALWSGIIAAGGAAADGAWRAIAAIIAFLLKSGTHP